MVKKLSEIGVLLAYYEAKLRYCWSKEARGDKLNRATLVSMFIILFFVICMVLINE